MDIITQGGQAHGEVANHLAANGTLDVGALRPFLERNSKGQWVPCVTSYLGGDPTEESSYSTYITTNATLRRDEWKALDDAVLKISETRLVGIQDLVSMGLTYQLGNAMGTTVLEWHDVSDALEAEITMDGVSRAKGDRPNFQYNYLPIPIIHVDYEINARALATSRNMGNPIDTTLAERATRKVTEKLENMLFTATTYAYGTKDARSRNSIYSYINHPDRNTVSITAWDASGKTAKQIVSDVLNAKKAAIAAKHYGPYQVYIPTAYETILDEDYDATTPGTTIRERILKISNIKDIKVIDTLPAANILVVQMTADVVRLVQGMPIQNVQWSTEGKLVNKYKVMTIQVPQIRSDQEGNSGIVHLSV